MNADNSIPIYYRHGHPANPERLRGAHVKLNYEGRTLLGEIVSIRYRNGPPSGYFLTVKHFNGEPWPIQPNAGSVRLLVRDNDGGIR